MEAMHLTMVNGDPATSPPGHEPAGHKPAGHEPAGQKLATGESQARQRWGKSPPKI